MEGVKIAHDINTDSIPRQMSESCQPIQTKKVSEEFAIFFDTKIKKVVDSVTIDKEVYNGKKMVYSSNELFMECNSNRSCILSLKHYHSEGYDHILQRIL